MNTEAQKKAQIKKLVIEMLSESKDAMIKKLDTVLNSGSISIENWDQDNAPMILPKTIITALLESESKQYDGGRTSHARQIKKDVRNIRYFI